MLRKKARVQFHLSHIKPTSKSKPNTTSQPTIRYSAIEPSLSTHLNPFKSTKQKIQLNLLTLEREAQRNRENNLCIEYSE